jgi:hypothetical protein
MGEVEQRGQIKFLSSCWCRESLTRQAREFAPLEMIASCASRLHVRPHGVLIAGIEFHDGDR